MNRRLLRGGIAIAAAVLLEAASAGTKDAPVWTPPRIVQRPETFDECLMDATGRHPLDNERKVDLTIAADGTLKEFSLSEGSPDWMKELTGCAIRQLRFSPASRNGDPVEAGASLTIQFRARAPDQSAGIAIEKVGPLIVAPRIWISGLVVANCVAASSVKPGSITSFIASFTVLTDGSAKDLVLPPGSERFQKEIASCVLL